jgi:hypothetical protein
VYSTLVAVVVTARVVCGVLAALAVAVLRYSLAEAQIQAAAAVLPKEVVQA